MKYFPYMYHGQRCVCVSVSIHTAAFVLILIEVVTWLAAAAVSADIIMTEMRTGHFIFPALINIWWERSKVSPNKNVRRFKIQYTHAHVSVSSSVFYNIKGTKGRSGSFWHCGDIRRVPIRNWSFYSNKNKQKNKQKFVCVYVMSNP